MVCPFLMAQPLHKGGNHANNSNTTAWFYGNMREGQPLPYKNRNTLPTAVIFILPYDVILLVKWLCCHIAGERAFLHIVRYLQYIAQIVVQKRKIWYNVDNDKFALVF